MVGTVKSDGATRNSAGREGFAERDAWSSVAPGWKPLFGSFQQFGVSFEWHDFIPEDELNWGKSFHPGGIEICLNLSGTGLISTGKEEAAYSAHSAGFYRQGNRLLDARRVSGERHQFLTVEYSSDFIRKHFGYHLDGLHPLVVSTAKEHRNASGMTLPQPLANGHQQLVQSLRQPPVQGAAQGIWYQSKALELGAFFFFQEPDEELFCVRQKRLARERVEKVISILRSDIAAPPNLEDLGKKVGCSHFYLSRTFSKEAGMTIAQYIRQIRMEKAAELLKSGKFNVTQAAFEVGYSSLSHFSQAFHETFGCCPGLYSLMPIAGKGFPSTRK